MDGRTGTREVVEVVVIGIVVVVVEVVIMMRVDEWRDLLIIMDYDQDSLVRSVRDFFRTDERTDVFGTLVGVK